MQDDVATNFIEQLIEAVGGDHYIEVGYLRQFIRILSDTHPEIKSTLIRHTEFLKMMCEES